MLESQTSERRIAMLIDGDNAQYSILELMLEKASRYGEVTIRRAYGDWTTPNLENWRPVMLAHAIQPIQQWRYTTGKNATDSALIIDAMDILHSGKVQGFCIVSSDSDYTRLCTRIREAGLFVMGMGRKQTAEAFTKACDEFVYVETLVQPAKAPQPKVINAQPPKTPPNKGTVNPQKPTPKPKAENNTPKTTESAKTPQVQATTNPAKNAPKAAPQPKAGNNTPKTTQSAKTPQVQVTTNPQKLTPKPVSQPDATNNINKTIQPTATPQTAVNPQKPIPGYDELISLFQRAIDASQPDKDGWVSLSALGSCLRTLNPSFDTSDHGYKTMLSLIKSLPKNFDIKGEKPNVTSTIYVRIKS